MYGKDEEGDGMMDIDIEKLAKKHFTEAQLKAQSITRWKDGIDIDEYPQLRDYTNEIIEFCITELHLNGELQAIECIRNIKVAK